MFINRLQTMSDDKKINVLIIEPFYGGSHKQLIDFLTTFIFSDNVNYSYDLVTLPSKKWHWRARTSALYMSRNIPSENYQLLFCSSVLNLAELTSLRKELVNVYKIIYFHENQFVYPQQKELDRDFQYGYNTILSALVADKVVFNSKFNMDSFLGNIDKHLRKQPDFRIKGISSEIAPKCGVIYFPLQILQMEGIVSKPSVLHIVWPHRWEHDKDPDLFFQTLIELKRNNFKFKVSVLGESYTDPPQIFEEAKTVLADEIISFGYLETKENYFKTLKSAHVVVSTAKHEFFGVAIVEAVLSGCCPLLPNNLVYPELYPPQYLYNTPQQLLKCLKNYCKRPYLPEKMIKDFPINLERFQESNISKQFMNIFEHVSE